MQRDLDALTRTSFDLVVIGGGIYGACAAWEATLRGLSVALIEARDFGGATSANSQKTIHGGLRYLQTLDLPRMRESIRERRTLLRIAPHLVRPLPFTLPAFGAGKHSPLALRAALHVNDAISADRNHGLAEKSQHVPASRVLSASAYAALLPDVPREGVTGAALWYDGQVQNSERLTLAFVHSAAQAGAVVANYVHAVEGRREGGRLAGVEVEDVWTGRRLTVRARLVLNTAGAWVDRVMAAQTGRSPARPTRWLKALNLVTRPLGGPQRVAFGLRNRTAPSLVPGFIFVTPWQDASLIGTAYVPYTGAPEACSVSEEEIAAFLKEINAAYPAARLARADVRFVHLGLLPADARHPRQLEPHYRLIDHTAEGTPGLLSVIGVKFTTARDVAERAVDRVCAQLGQGGPRGRSRVTRLHGARLGSVEALLQEALRDPLWDLSEPVLRRLIETYGSAYGEVLRLVRENLAWGQPLELGGPVLKAEAAYAVRAEMAQTLSDVIFRRLGLGAAGHPGAAILRPCAEVMAGELGWDRVRVEKELQDTGALFKRHGAMAPQRDSARSGRGDEGVETMTPTGGWVTRGQNRAGAPGP
jgi:glycerol-3-phosphate dehydrogenase